MLDDALLMVELAAGRFHTVLHGIPRLPAHETGVHTCGSGQKDESRRPWGNNPGSGPLASEAETGLKLQLVW